MRISVIIPTYNRAAWLEECLRSVFCQTLLPDEVVVVDDGSTDDTTPLLQRLAQASPVPLMAIRQENLGAAAARNTGIRAASGAFLSFLDSDDRFLPEKIACQYDLLHRAGALVSHTRELWFRRGKTLGQKKKHQPPQGDIFQASLSMCVVGMSTVMARRELFERFGLFDEALPCCEDYDFWLRVGCREPFLLVDSPLTLKNGGRPDQLSVRYRVGMDKYRIGSLVNLLESGRLDRRQYHLALVELQRKCFIYGQGCIKHGRLAEGSGYLQLPARFMELEASDCRRSEAI